MQSAGGCGREIVGVLMERLPSATAAGDGASHDSGHWHGIVSSGLHGATSSNGSRQDTTEYSDLLCCNGPRQWRCRGSADLAVGSDGISAGEDCTEASDSERQSAQRAAGSSVGHGVRFSTPLSTAFRLLYRVLCRQPCDGGFEQVKLIKDKHANTCRGASASDLWHVGGCPDEAESWPAATTRRGDRPGAVSSRQGKDALSLDR